MITPIKTTECMTDVRIGSDEIRTETKTGKWNEPSSMLNPIMMTTTILYGQGNVQRQHVLER